MRYHPLGRPMSLSELIDQVRKEGRTWPNVTEADRAKLEARKAEDEALAEAVKLDPSVAIFGTDADLYGQY